MVTPVAPDGTVMLNEISPAAAVKSVTEMLLILFAFSVVSQLMYFVRSRLVSVDGRLRTTRNVKSPLVVVPGARDFNSLRSPVLRMSV